MSGRRSRNKGKGGEREFAALARSCGFEKAARGAQHRGGPTSPDVEGIPGVHVEVKKQGTMAALYPALEQAQREAPEGVLPIVGYRMVRKGTGPGGAKPWLVAVDAEKFLGLWRAICSDRWELPTGEHPLDEIGL